VSSEDLVPSLLTTSDVLGTGWFAADAANVQPGSTVVVVGDGAVGLLGVLSAKQMGAERIIAMSRHEKRQQIAREFGHLPRALSEGGQRTHAYEVGDIGYWSPGGDVTIYYRQDGAEIPDPGIIVIGKLDAGVEALNVPGSVNVTIEVVSQS
jgi:threonine dehydrogenase-like Zn-dependent dehydrogenase